MQINVTNGIHVLYVVDNKTNYRICTVALPDGGRDDWSYYDIEQNSRIMRVKEVEILDTMDVLYLSLSDLQICGLHVNSECKALMSDIKEVANSILNEVCTTRSTEDKIHLEHMQAIAYSVLNPEDESHYGTALTEKEWQIRRQMNMDYREEIKTAGDCVINNPELTLSDVIQLIFNNEKSKVKQKKN